MVRRMGVKLCMRKNEIDKAREITGFPQLGAITKCVPFNAIVPQWV